MKKSSIIAFVLVTILLAVAISVFLLVRLSTYIYTISIINIETAPDELIEMYSSTITIYLLFFIISLLLIVLFLLFVFFLKKYGYFYLTPEQKNIAELIKAEKRQAAKNKKDKKIMQLTAKLEKLKNEDDK